ncbi:ATP-binding protein [Rubrivirga sp. IMCC43871]|uniref:hybrid sensor histidine kinase/response regulator transcription factor n=1 Tax=Rubrivirga sp. IMCC43871 TaxID=3391575 RepID=UPI00398FEBD2
MPTTRAVLGLALALFTLLAGPASVAPPEILSVADVVGSNDPQWVRITGRHFPADPHVRVRSEGVDVTVSGPDRVRSPSPGVVEVRVTVGNEAVAWSVEVGGAGQPLSNAALFTVQAPRPTVSHVAVVRRDHDRPTYTLRVFGDGYANYSDVVLDGKVVPSEPIASSPYATSLTVGLAAVIDRELFQETPTREIRVFTRGPGGGVSDPFTLSIDPIPLWYRAPFWASLFIGFAAVGIGLHIIRVHRVRTRELETLVDQRTADLSRERARTQTQADALAAQAAELREARDVRSHLFATVSHELRTPLTLVQAPLDEVLSGRHGPVADAVHATLLVARANVKRLVALVGRLSKLARLQPGATSIDPRPIDLVHLVGRVVDGLHPLAERRQAHLELGVGAALMVHADPTVLGDAICNVVQNAIQHSPPGGTVRVAAERSPDGALALVEVADEGPGVPDHDRERIFERFEGGRGGEGLGLGLAITRHALRAHGGDVTVEPAGRRGARFRLAIPALPTDSVAAAAPDPIPDSLSHPPPVSHPIGPPPGGPDLQVGLPLVYLVDDNDQVRHYIARALAPAFRVLQASSAEAAAGDLQAWADRTAPAPDALVLDVMMPGTGGLDLVRALRQTPTLADLPVLFLSARAGPDARREAKDAGGDDYLEKPFDAAELVSSLRRLIARRREMQARYRTETALGPLGVIQSEDEQFLDRLRAAVAENLSDPTFRVDALAVDVGLSKSQLGRRLKAAVGMTPAQFLRTLRLEHAAALLRAGRRVGEVAGAVGFQDVDYFSRLFSETFGTRPSEVATSNPGPDAVDALGQGSSSEESPEK